MISCSGLGHKLLKKHTHLSEERPVATRWKKRPSTSAPVEITGDDVMGAQPLLQSSKGTVKRQGKKLDNLPFLGGEG